MKLICSCESLKGETMRRVWRISLEFSAYYLSFYLCRYSVLPLLPSIAAEVGLSYGQLAASISMLYAGYALALTPSGLAAAAVGAWRLLLGSAAVTVLANLLLALARDWITISLLLFVNGLAQGAAWPSLMQAVAVEFRGSDVDYVVGAMLTAALFGPSAAFLLASLVMYVANWRVAFVASAAPLAALSPVIAAGRRGRRGEPRGEALGAVKRLAIWLLGMAYACHYALLRGLLSWLPTMLVEVEGLEPPTASLLSGAVPLASACIAVVGALLSRRTSPWSVIALSFAAAALLTTYSLATGLSAAVATAVILALSLSEWLYFTQLPQLLPPREVGLASGLVDTLGYAGSSLGTMLLASAVEGKCPAGAVLIPLAGLSAAVALRLRGPGGDMDFRRRRVC
ncbi:MAG: hypothetical protein DRJ96_08600 [Thermoprotei archaeon]|nr:MAG: hypothetical protein DRJ96_08600 [Thermoprotei archaeon]